MCINLYFLPVTTQGILKLFQICIKIYRRQLQIMRNHQETVRKNLIFKSVLNYHLNTKHQHIVINILNKNEVLPVKYVFLDAVQIFLMLNLLETYSSLAYLKVKKKYLNKR